MSEVLKLTEILTEVQNFITADGQIVPAQRNFYQNLRIKMNNHTGLFNEAEVCLLYTSPSPRDMRRSRMPSSA